MKLSTNVLAIFFITSFVASAPAQGVPELFTPRTEISGTLRQATKLSEELEEVIQANVPIPDGWDCSRNKPKAARENKLLEAIPIAFLQCRKAEQSLQVRCMLDSAVATNSCKDVEATKVGMESGSVSPKLIHFFNSESWNLMRRGTSIIGCLRGELGLSVQAVNRHAAIDAGPAFIDEFGATMLEMSIGSLTSSDLYARHQLALEKLLDQLRSQSLALSAMLPNSNVVDKIMFPRSPENANSPSIPLPMELLASPSAGARLDASGCRIKISLSASETDKQEASWAQPGGTDGKVRYAYMRRNKERLVGREATNGSGIEVLVDEQVTVRVLLSGSDHCVDEPGIVIRLFSEIMTNEFSLFGVQ